jgi:UDP-N-acetylglucosamine 4,6-dehydratase/5-epimerase
MQVAGRKFYISGGTGSFGTEMTKYLLSQDATEIRIFSRDEKKQSDMRVTFNDPRIKFYIGDVRDYCAVKAAMIGVDHVFHAAALKQVPSCEFFPLEALKTNTLGAANILDAMKVAGITSAVFLSTDKAVYPINAMGLTKALMEKIVVATARESDGEDSPVVNVTRYGNVMASRGSVIPLFADLARRGEPIPVTDLKMTRFLMSLEESVDLVLKAWSATSSGNIFVRKAPACTVETLARAIIKITHSRSKISVIGIRHGEKQNETLVSTEEMSRANDLGDYFVIRPDERSLNYGAFVDKGISPSVQSKFQAAYDSSSDDCMDVDAVAELLVKIFGEDLNV